MWATYDQKPEMSAYEVTDRLLGVLQEAAAAGAPYDLVVLNFANGDMVGHTGILQAAVAACEAVDKCLGRIAGYILDIGGSMLITADHGNAEIMVDPETPWPVYGPLSQSGPPHPAGQTVPRLHLAERRGAEGYRPDHPCSAQHSGPPGNGGNKPAPVPLIPIPIAISISGNKPTAKLQTPPGFCPLTSGIWLHTKP
jgi:hypothetical protein